MLKYDIVKAETMREMIDRLNIKTQQGWYLTGTVKPLIVRSQHTTEYSGILKRTVREIAVFHFEYLATIVYEGE